MNIAYLRLELRRLVRNRQSFIFALIIPVALFYAIAAPNKNTDIVSGISFARYYFAGMIALGTIAAVLSGGARIALERQIGWNRQLRLTPLSPYAYLRTKVLTSYLLAIIALLLVTAAALSIGTKLPLDDWLKSVGLVLIALIPFAALGVMLGHLIKGDAMGPVIGLGVTGFAMLGGAYFPIGQNGGFMHVFVRLIPSFWLVQGGKTGVGGISWDAEAWIVIAVWTVAMTAGAAWAYRRDTKRAS